MSPRSFLLTLLLLLSALPPLAHAQATVLVPAQGTLQQAIASVGDGGIIEIAAGTYTAPAGGFLIIDANKRFTIRAATGANVVLSGNNSTNVLRFVNNTPGTGKPVSFERLTFANGVSNAFNLSGGVSLIFSQGTFVGCTFQNNSAPIQDGGGGGMHVQASVVTIIDSQFTGNSAQRNGGGIAINDNSRVTIHNSRFVSNRVNLPNHYPYSLGGAIFLLNASLRFTNTRFENNQAGFSGGAIYSFGTWSEPLITPRADVLGTNSTFVGNIAQRDATSPAPGATTGGGVQTEDHVTLKLYNSRFTNNVATVGGAVANYRSIVEIYGGTFQGNRAIGTAGGDSYGGAIVTASDDQDPADTQNRRTASLLVRDSLFQGRFGATGFTARHGGCIFAVGDTNRAYGLAAPSIPQMGTVPGNRAVVDVRDSVFYDCDVQHNGEGGVGGGLMTQLTDLTIADSLFLKCDAIAGSPNTGSGGGIAMFDNTAANLQRVTIAQSTASLNGAALWVQGSNINMSNSRIIDNQLNAGAWAGAILYAAPENLGAPRQAVNVTGLLQNNLFSNNTGGAGILDFDSPTPPVNLVQYAGNTVFPNNSTFYANPIAPSTQTVAQLNSLSLHGSPKAPTANTGVASAPATGAIIAAPNTVLATNAAGDAAPPTTAYVAYAWSGGSATLNGGGVSGGSGLTAMPAGAHTLSVAGTPFSDTISNGSTPATTLRAQPRYVAPSGSSLLSWQTASGTYLEQFIDQGIAAPLAASGNVALSALIGSRTYRNLLIAQEGGALASAPLQVIDGLIFKDGFE
jgi:predicted outer membrane repeat protein